MALDKFTLAQRQGTLQVERDSFRFRHLSSDYFPEDALQRSLFESMIVRLMIHFPLPANFILLSKWIVP